MNIEKSLDNGTNMNPPRSGHVAFQLDEKIYVFGGYAEERAKDGDVKRYPTNDLWCFQPTKEGSDSKKNEWKLVQRAASNSSSSPSQQPRNRLAAASVACKLNSGSVGVILGGWDSGIAGTGGEILKDVQIFDTSNADESSSNKESNSGWRELSIDLEQPTSRLCALSLNLNGENDDTILIHNHRCTDHVLLLDLQSMTLKKQPVSGSVPSARGLHACARLSNNKIVLFGGAAQDGTMSNEVFLLDLDTWVWGKCRNTVAGTEEQIANEEENDDTNATTLPSARAAPCFVALDTNSCLLYGGASVSNTGGLHGCSDTWVLELIPDDDDSDLTLAVWTRMNQDGSPQAPPGRNAATLMPLPSSSFLANNEDNGADTNKKENDNETTQHFLLSGGWYPFRKTYDDNFVLRVTKKNLGLHKVVSQ